MSSRAPLLLRRHRGFDTLGHAHPRERPQLGHPSPAHQPGQDVEIGALVVFAGDEGRIRPRRHGQHAQHLGQGGQSGEESGVGLARGGELRDVRVGRDDVGVALMEGRDGARASPVY